MKKLMLITILGLLNLTTLFADISISGYLLDYDGQPLQYSEVYRFDKKSPDSPTLLYICDDKGYFKIDMPNTMNKLTLLFAAANRRTSQLEFFAEPDDKIELKINIGTYPTWDKNSTIKLLAESNNDDKIKTRRMNTGEDGIYSAKLKLKSDTISYRISLILNAEEKIIGGQQGDFRKLNKQFEYETYILNMKEPIEIKFDINKLKPFGKTPVFKSTKSELSELIDVRIEFGSIEIQKMGGMDLMQAGKMSMEQFDSLKVFIANEIAELWKKCRFGPARVFLAVEYLKEISFGQILPKDTTIIDKSIIEYISQKLPPESNIWNSNYYEFFWFCAIMGDPLSGPHLNRFIKPDADFNSRGWVLKTCIDYAIKQKDTNSAMEKFDVLKELYPGHPAINSANKRYNLEKTNKIIVGKIIPYFELPNMDKPGEMISTKSLEGKYVLIDVWGTWCGPCVAELPHLQEVYDKFSDSGFVIYSLALDRAPEVIQQFRERNKYKMPWLHSFLENGRDNEVYKLLEVTSTPKTILIGPDGTILDVNSLRGEKLMKTLSKLLNK